MTAQGDREAVELLGQPLELRQRRRFRCSFRRGGCWGGGGGWKGLLVAEGQGDGGFGGENAGRMHRNDGVLRVLVSFLMLVDG